MRAIFIALGFMLSAPGIADEYADKARGYLAAKEAVQQPGSMVADVEHMLGFVAENYRGQHLRYGKSACQEHPDGGKNRLRAGLMHYLGQYGGSKIHIKQVIEGYRVAVVSFDETISTKQDGEWVTETTPMVLVFEFNEDGLIEVVRRYG